MYFKINIISIFLSYQCINVYAADYKTGIPGRYNCYVKMPLVDNGFMPVPFHGNVTRPSVIRPDSEGNYLFTHNTIFKLSCAGSSFIAPTRYAAQELPLLCLNGFLWYRNRTVYFNAFRCEYLPVPSIKLTKMTCQNNENNSILEVGFQTKNHFLKTYRLCFDIILKKTVYSWYYVTSPTGTIRQTQLHKPYFIETRLFDGINLTSTYSYDVQKKSLEFSFNSTEMVEKIFVHSHLTPGHLLSQEEFVYVSEQHSTYFYENTVPMWSRFHNRVWRLLQKLFRRNLLRGSARHLVVTGTHGFCEVPNTGEPGPVFLSSHDRIPIPEYVWKLDYDVDRRSGTVFIGYNHPFLPLNKTRNLDFCNPIPCPGHFTREAVKYIVFCCTKESFEKHFGLLDQFLFRPF